MEQFIVSLMEKAGPTLTVIFVLMFMIWRMTRYVGARMLDEDNGILTKVAEKHVEFIDGVQTTNTNLTSMMAQTKDSTDTIQRTVSDIVHCGGKTATGIAAILKSVEVGLDDAPLPREKKDRIRRIVDTAIRELENQ